MDELNFDGTGDKYQIVTADIPEESRSHWRWGEDVVVIKEDGKIYKNTIK